VGVSTDVEWGLVKEISRRRMVCRNTLLKRA
jgi:hypothetical protein